MKDLPILIQEPELISLINQVKNGAVPLSELKRKIGRRKVEKGIHQARSKILSLKIGIKEYLKDPIKYEIEFIKECFGMQNGREVRQFSLDEKVHVQQINNESILLIIKGDL